MFRLSHPKAERPVWEIIMATKKSQSEFQGANLGDGTSVSGSPGDPVLEVCTLELESSGELRARLASVAGISAFADSDFPIHVVHTGVIDAQPHRMRLRLRPAPGGISCGAR